MARKLNFLFLTVFITIITKTVKKNGQNMVKIEFIDLFKMYNFVP